MIRNIEISVMSLKNTESLLSQAYTQGKEETLKWVDTEIENLITLHGLDNDTLGMEALSELRQLLNQLSKEHPYNAIDQEMDSYK